MNFAPIILPFRQHFPRFSFVVLVTIAKRFADSAANVSFLQPLSIFCPICISHSPFFCAFSSGIHLDAQNLLKSLQIVSHK